MASPGGRDAADRVLALLLFTGVVAYLCYLPRNLGAADESYFLYEASRLRDGQLMYRDVFDFVTPLSSYAMAGLFWIFGTNMGTARISMAFLQGGTAVMLYLSSRRLGVRQELAAAMPLAYVAICVLVWPYASWHWYSTLATAVLLFALIAGPWASRPRWAFVPGVICGVAIGVQQQKGVVLAAGTGLVFILDSVLSQRSAAPEPWRRLATRLGWFAAGAAAIVVPVLGAFVILAGAPSVYEALVRFPLENYRSNFHIAWGMFGPLAQRYAAYTLPPVLHYSPLALVVPFARWCWAIVRRDQERVRMLTALLVVASASVLSIWYFPDGIHIAFIGGVLWVAAAEGAEWVVSALRPRLLSRLAGVLALVLVGSPLVVHVVRATRLLEHEYAVRHQTAFGRVDFSAQWQVVLLDKVRALLDATPSRTLFSYPFFASIYLTAGGRNPTPYQYFFAGVSPEEQTADVLRILQTQQLPYVVASPFFMRPGDPVAQYIQDHYRMVELPQMSDAELPSHWLYSRNDLPPTDDPAP